MALIDAYPKEIEVREQAVQVTVFNQGDRPGYMSVSLSRLLKSAVSPPGKEETAKG